MLPDTEDWQIPVLVSDHSTVVQFRQVLLLDEATSGKTAG